MENVTFRRCKDILCHDQYIHVLYGPASPGLEKKRRVFCECCDLFCLLFAVL